MNETKSCMQCSKTITRKPTEPPAKWATRTFCSRSCSNASRLGGEVVYRRRDKEPLTAHDEWNRQNLLTYFISRGRATPQDNILEVISRTAAPGVREAA